MPSNYRSMRNAAAGAFAATAARDAYRSGIKYGNKLLKRGNRSTKWRPRALIHRTPTYTTAAKRHNTDKLLGGVSSHTLHTMPLTMIPQGTNIGERERQLIRLRGFKIHYALRMITSVPTYNRLAVVKFKYRGDSSTSPDIGTDFFRGQQTSRAVEFSSVANAQHLYDYQINTDKFEVLWDHKFIVGPQVASNLEENVYMKYIDKFVPCSKLVHFDDSDLYSDSDGVFLVHFLAPWTSNSSTPVANLMNTRAHATTYFTDVL